MAPSNALAYVGIAAGAAVIGVGGYLLLRKSRGGGCPGPTCDGTCCPAADVCPSGGDCPSGYQPDPDNPGCCESASSGGGPIFAISGQTGSLVLNCNPCALNCGGTGCLVCNDLTLQVTNATPNGNVEFYIATTEGDWAPLPNPVTGDPEIVQADAYGNISLPFASCYICGGSPTFGACPGCGSMQVSLVYIVAQDLTTNLYSDVIALNSNCSGDCCQVCDECPS